MTIEADQATYFPTQATVGKAPRRRQWERRHTMTVLSVDVVAAIFGAVIAYLIRFSVDAGDSAAILSGRTPAGARGGYVWFSLALPALWMVALRIARAYDHKAFGIGAEEFARVMHAAIGLTATIAFYSYAAKAEVARGYVVIALPLIALMSLVGRYAARKILHRNRKRGRCMSDVVAVGTEVSVAELVAALRRDPGSGLRAVGICLIAPSTVEEPICGLPVLGGLDDVVSATSRIAADTVVVASGADLQSRRLRRLSWQLERTGTRLIVAPGLVEVAGPRLHIRPVIGLPLLHVEEPEFAGARRVIKGGFDRVAAGAALLALAPVIAAIGIAVRLSSPGPAFFRQVRVGRNGRQFSMIKFRTMVQNAELRLTDLTTYNQNSDGPLFKMRSDPRVTRIGRVLRKYSLDELPQLFNVLTGSMSLVGPRPPLPREVARYGEDVRRRLLVKPGLTGLWQISGRSDLPWEEAVRLDLRYVENWSLALDVSILLRTFSAVVKSSGAY